MTQKDSKQPTDSILVKPASEGLICRHPVTHEVLPAKGALWPNTQLTRRYIKSGDVVRVEVDEDDNKKTQTTELAPTASSNKNSQKKESK